MWGTAKQNHNILLVTHIIIILDTVSLKQKCQNQEELIPYHCTQSLFT